MKPRIDAPVITANDECFFPDAGTHDYVRCGICNYLMDVTPNQTGPTSYIEAIAKGKNNSTPYRAHDAFFCPNRKEPWHLQAKSIIVEARHTSSKRLETMLLEEALEIIETQVETKKVY